MKSRRENSRKIDWDLAKELYLIKKMSIGDIAKQFQCDPTTVWNALKEQGVNRRGKHKQRNISDDVFIDAVAVSFSKHGVLRILGLSTGKFSYKWLNEQLERLNPDTSHWTRKRAREKRPLKEYLVEDSSYTGTSSQLRKWLIKEEHFVNECSVCGLTQWQGKPITIQLDHINGKRHDHRLSNLRMLCPNCHSQTDTFSGRNQKKS